MSTEEEIKNNSVSLWQSTNIKLPNGKYLIALYYYKTYKGANKKNGFYHCAIRIDTKENWFNYKTAIISDNPASILNLKQHLNINDDFNLMYSNRVFNKTDFYKWIGTKFSEKKIETLENFINKSQKERYSPILTKYNINNETQIDFTTDYDKLEDGIWYMTSKPKNTKPRKPYGRVIQ